MPRLPLYASRGRWAPPAGAGEREDLLGLVIVKGVLCREVAIRDRHGLEFLRPGAEDRVLLMLWHLAEAWGRQTPEGVVLPIPLTHDVLGQLIAARRSTVTLAVGQLEEQGCVRRMEDGSWLLSTTAALRVQLLTRTTQHQTALGENVMLRQLTRETREQARALRGEAAQIRSRRPTPSPRRPSN